MTATRLAAENAQPSTWHPLTLKLLLQSHIIYSKHINVMIDAFISVDIVAQIGLITVTILSIDVAGANQLLSALPRASMHSPHWQTLLAVGDTHIR